MFLPDTIAHRDFTKLFMLALSITAAVFLMSYVPAIFWVRLGLSQVSPETLMSQVPRGVPNYQDVIRRHRIEGKRRERQQVETAMLLAGFLSFIPLYLPLLVRLFTEVGATTAIVTIAIASFVVSVITCAVVAGMLQRPGNPIGGTSA